MPLHNPAHWPEILVERMREKIGAFWRIEARLKGARVGRDVILSGRPVLSVAGDSKLELQDRVVLRSGLRSTPLACSHPCVLRTLARKAELILEEGVGLSGTVICAASSVRVGSNTIMGSGVMVIDTDFHRLQPAGTWGNDFRGTARPIMIGRSVFVGTRAIILKGVTIGDRAIIGAGAVVTHEVPADSVAAGNPARIVTPPSSTAS